MSLALAWHLRPSHTLEMPGWNEEVSQGRKPRPNPRLFVETALVECRKDPIYSKAFVRPLAKNLLFFAARSI